jgi:hypothetical protein
MIQQDITTSEAWAVKRHGNLNDTASQWAAGF